MEYLILVGAAIVRRWIEWLGWQAANAIAWLILGLIMLTYAGWVVFADRGETKRRKDGE